MQIAQLLENQQIKKKLEAKRQKKIKKRLLDKKRKQINLDHDHFKSGQMQKTKIISKKTFKKQVQKARKIPIQIQDNINVNTFLTQTTQYLNILSRTKQKISFDNNQLLQGCKAISAYAKQNKQQNITIHLTMENQIECSQRPTLLHLPFPQQNIKCIIIANDLNQIQSKQLKQIDLKIMKIKEFVKKFREDKKFKKQLKKKLMRIFCTFSIYCKSKAIQKLIKSGIPVFPIDQKKVPFALQEQCIDYDSYLLNLLSKSYCITKSGKQHYIRIKNRHFYQLGQNIKQIIYQIVAKLINRSKIKGNKVQKVHLKTETSLSIPIFS